MRQVPEKPSLEGLEAKWRARWEEHGTYRFDRSRSRDEIYSIDTPPPTVSGRLHPGHVCSYTHTDIVARYHRMRGDEVFYPMGWDDNGLNVERRVQLMLGVTCDPSLPYDPDFTPPEKPPKQPIAISRPNFVEQCERVTEMLEQSYFDLWSTVGLSVDWTHTYTTIGPKATRTSQRGFLRLLERDIAYRAEAPTLWDVDMKTAVAQAELEDRELPGAYHKLRFERPDGEPVWIDTTRPELLPACVALVAHPGDERYQPLFGTTVTTPLFRAEVPVVAHELADPEKGTGIAMICTFGDTTDVIWWRELDLPIRAVVQRDGRLTVEAPEGVDPGAYAEVAGKGIKQAQKRIVEMLDDAGLMEGEPRPITHPVKFWENGNRPLEIVTTRQWFIRYPPKDEMLERGRQLRWHPAFMRVRYENWVNGLAGDWNITRQRFFGVPFPVWYPVGDDGEVRWNEPITATEDRLPVDPTTDVPDGFTEDQRDRPGGFTADPDVMDTWATSSMSPQIIGGWVDDPDLYERVYPMDLRPQAHEIIRTWLFYTVIRSHYHEGKLPWSDAAISGFVIDPERKKMSKSAGNAEDDPVELIDRHGADAVRYWAAGGRPGMDIALDRNQFKIGRRLATKLLNASRFALSIKDSAIKDSAIKDSAIKDSAVDASAIQGEPGTVTAPVDRALLAALAEVVEQATTAFDDYEYTKALERIEPFFWHFCDDYLELVKGRAYGTFGAEAAASAQATLRLALSVLLRLFAPFLPFVTEEVWSWWQEGSVHRSRWPAGDELAAGASADRAPLTAAAEVLGQIRKAKSEAKLSMRAPVERVIVRDVAERIAALQHAADDVREAGTVTQLDLVEGEEFDVQVELAETA